MFTLLKELGISKKMAIFLGLALIAHLIFLVVIGEKKKLGKSNSNRKTKKGTGENVHKKHIYNL